MQIQYAQHNTGSYWTASGTYTDYLTVPITVVGASATIQMDAFMGAVKGSTGNISARIMWDGVQVAESTVSTPSGYDTNLCVGCVVTGVAAGAHAAILQIKENTTGTVVGGAGRGACFVVIEH